jgi:hypothetical protein
MGPRPFFCRLVSKNWDRRTLNLPDNERVLRALDLAFFIFHTGLIVFNLVGWAFPRTRRWQLYTLAATALSWFVMGFWRGIGYCLCTDWHFQVRRQLGYSDDSPTYVHLLIKSMTGANLDHNLVQSGTAMGFAFCLLMGIYANFILPRRLGGA